ncbi:MAG: molybdenum ABC transporter ATP-binding protein [Planctomycetes bacterium]|nr:molybdenum ABC transporter ATP-binding protein [Planctomycetota bacterium]
MADGTAASGGEPAQAPFVQAAFRLARGGFSLDASFVLDGRGACALFGPSGAGKTTLLRCLAGLEPDARGRLVVDGETWHDDAPSRRVFRPPWMRPVGYVFQDAQLFAHLDVRGNLRFGERRVPRSDRRVRFDDVVGWFGLDALLARRVGSLSGGERQRVAIGRALLTSPRLLLMDEPLSALDVEARARILPRLAALPRHFGIPVLYVSHALSEVARLCDALVWLDAGRVRAAGGLDALLPDVGAATDDEGLSVSLHGCRVARHHPGDELSELSLDGAALFVRALDLAPGTTVELLVHARDVSVALAAGERSSILNELPARLVSVHEARGGVVLRLQTVGGRLLLARITKRSLRQLELRPGVELLARVKSVSVAGGASPELV